ncbi:MAG: DIP1984 family protein [Candidatus Riflebacteria bacterium]|nr:DIP1984 family protein [Candidatus Riflebacteria bacterium]
MKLAQALIERKAIKTKIEELKKRIYQQARIQEGDKPIENPASLIEELKHASAEFEKIVVKINKTNISTKINDNLTMMEALIKKDMLNLLHMVHVNLADKALPNQDRYSQREIKNVPNIDVPATRKRADEIAKEYRLLDTKIQECNWTIDLVE